MLDRLEEIGSYYNAANLAAGNLRALWQKKDNYWDATEEAFDGTRKQEEAELNSGK